MADEPDTQRISRLTPVADVLARLDAQVAAVAPCEVEVSAALGQVLAQDIAAPAARPATALALRDGFAVCADAIADASAYAPAPFAAAPCRLNVGDALPAGADAVAPLDAVVGREGRWEAIAAVAPGEGVLAAGADLSAGEPVRRAGERLRAVDAAVLAVAGVARVQVRAPRVRLVQARPGDAVLGAACGLIARAIAADGGAVEILEGYAGSAAPAGDFAAALGDGSVDAVVAVGGTGSGRNDASVRTLSRHGRLDVHGIALQPGETAAFGFAGIRPVLLLPGRLDAALAVWLAVGSRMLRRLSAATEDPAAARAVLTRKVASPLGLLDIVPVCCRDGQAEPLASGYWPLRTLAQADGWIAVPAESEGYPAGAEVMVRPWP